MQITVISGVADEKFFSRRFKDSDTPLLGEMIPMSAFGNRYVR